jgi:glycosyltransferase involved in cell wall biosynthesis
VKIGLINTLYSPYRVGGAEKSVQLLAEGLVSAGNEVFVVTCAERRSQESLNGVRVYREPLANVYWPFKAGKQSLLKPVWHFVDALNPLMGARVRQIVERERPDVVNTNNLSGFSASVWEELMALGVPVVHTVRDYYLLCSRSTMYRQKQNANCDDICANCRALSWPRRTRAKSIEHVIGISGAVLAEHTKRGIFRNAHTCVIPNIAGAVAEPSSVVRTPPFVRFGYLGRIEASKGIAELLQSFQMALSTRRDIRLVLGGAGDDAYIATLTASVRTHSVRFLGLVDPAAFFADIDFLVVPSRWKEPLGRVVLEAHQYGVPVLGARRGGISEYIADGVTGFGFDVTEPSALADLMLRCAEFSSEQYTRLRSALLAERHRFATEAVVQSHLAAFRKALEDRRCRT